MYLKKTTLALLLLFISVGCASPSKTEPAPPSPTPTFLEFTTPIPSPTPTSFRTPFITPESTLRLPSGDGSEFIPAFTEDGLTFTTNFDVIQAAEFVDRSGDQRTIILIRNDRDDNIMIREMSLEYISKDRQTIVTTNGFSAYGPVPADSLYVFEYEGYVTSMEWSEINVEAECTTLTSELFTEFVAHSVVGGAEEGGFLITGRITNLNDELVEFVEIRAAFYNSAGVLIGYGSYKSWNFSYRPVGPGGTISFAIFGEYDPNSVIDSYELFMYGY